MYHVERMFLHSVMIVKKNQQATRYKATTSIRVLRNIFYHSAISAIPICFGKSLNDNIRESIKNIGHFIGNVYMSMLRDLPDT